MISPTLSQSQSISYSPSIQHSMTQPAYPAVQSPPRQQVALPPPGYQAADPAQRSFQPISIGNRPQPYYAPQRQISSKVVQANQLQNLPHAPQSGLWQFPNVPDVELAEPAIQQKQPEMLIEL